MDANGTISIPLVEETVKWLGKDGIDFFKEMKTQHGRVDPVLTKGGYPHPVHLREGMQVRNFMRSTEYCKEWTDHELDDNWTKLIELCLDLIN